MKIQISNALVSDVLIVGGIITAVVAAWFLGWEAGMIGSGLAVAIMGVVLRGMDLIGGGRRGR
jgi:hypothetical protein